MDYLEQNYVEVQSENVTKLCMRCSGSYLFKMREKDYSNIICATIYLQQRTAEIISTGEQH